MKKYILMMLVVLAAGFTSCSNDDIPFEEKVTYKTFETTFVVNPSGVVKPYRFESYPGELTALSSDAQLRLRILIYNSDGILVDILTNKQSNYQSVWSAKKLLEAGKYTALVISDVVNTNNPDVEEYWHLEDYEKINDAKLIREFNYLGYQKEILGICSVPFSVVSSASDVSLNLKPVGAACYFQIKNLEKYTNVKSYALFTDHKINYGFWNSSFKMDFDRDISSGSTLWEGFNDQVGGVIGLDEIDFEGTGNDFTAFFYVIPSEKQYFVFVAETTDVFEIGTQMYIPEVKEGEQYFFICELGVQYGNYARTSCYDVTGISYDEFYKWYWEDLKQYNISRTMNTHDGVFSSLSMQKKDNAVYIKNLINK